MRPTAWLSPLLWRELRFAASLQDRLADVGVVSMRDALELGAVGPSARAARVRHDTRTESPRLQYDDFHAVAPKRKCGDVMARLDVRQLEPEQTFELLGQLLASGVLPGRAGMDPDPGTLGVSRVESLRDETLCAIHTDGTTLSRLHLRTGSYANWPGLAHAVRENPLPDFPLINKTFELCYACADR